MSKPDGECEFGSSTFAPDCKETKVIGSRFCHKHLAIILRAGEMGK